METPITQTEADVEIKKLLTSYLSSQTASISGTRFSKLLQDLTEIENRWFTDTVIPYLKHINQLEETQ